GDAVLAGERAGVGDREFARLGGAAELIGDDRPAARGRGLGEAAQRVRLPDGFEEQQVAVDIRIVERRRANLADAEIDLEADRDQRGKANAARLAARGERANDAAAV